MTKEFKITNDDIRQIEEYVERRKKLGWDMERIMEHLYLGLLSKGAAITRMTGHFKTNRHIKNNCSERCWCREDGVGQYNNAQRKAKFRIKALIHLANAKSKRTIQS